MGARRVAMLSDARGPFVRAEFLSEDDALLGIADCSHGQRPAWCAAVWNVLDGRVLYQLPRKNSELTALATNPRHNLFAIGNGSVAEIYDLSTGTLRARLAGHSSDVCQLAFSPDGNLVASVCNDHIARVWDWAHETELHQLIGSYAAVFSCLAFSPDGRTLVTGEHGGWVRFWNTESGLEMINLRVYGQPMLLKFSPNAKRLACWSTNASTEGQHEVRIWSVERTQSAMETTR